MPLSYAPLEPGSIRLLTINDNTGLDCSMEEYTFADTLPYTALSYCWRVHGDEISDDGAVGELRINGQCLAVRKNLSDALAHIGGFVRAAGFMLWVDALCINQDDLAERTQQVKMMKAIYEQAATIIAWVGPPDDEAKTRLAVQMMWTVVRYDLKDVTRHYQRVRGPMSSSQWQKVMLESHPMFSMDNQSDVLQAWEGVVQIFRRSYWSRTWMHQEITLQGVEFYCGLWCFGWNELLAITSFFEVYLRHRGLPSSHHSLVDDYLGASPAIQALSTALYNRRESLEKSRPEMSRLLPLIRQLRLTSCSDPRDKVFAALPHATDMGKTENEHLKDLGYADSLCEIYTAVVHDSICTERSLEVLGYVSRLRSDSTLLTLTDSTASLPSWVPDWRAPSRIRPLNCTGYLNASYRIVYEPCPGTSNADVSIRGAELHVKGFVFDTLKAVASYLETFVPDFEKIQRASKTCLIGQCQSWNEEALDRTMVADARCRRSAETGRTVTERGFATDWDLLATQPADLKSEQSSLRTEMSACVTAVCRERRAGCTTAGRIGVFPEFAVAGDFVAAFYGGNTLYIIREIGDQPGRYEFVGECYVDEMMDGQVMKLAQEKGIVASTLVLL